MLPSFTRLPVSWYRRRCALSGRRPANFEAYFVSKKTSSGPPPITPLASVHEMPRDYADQI
jgi:hypothetical protein